MEEEEQGPPKKSLQKSQEIIERKQRCEQLNAVSLKYILMMMTFDK
jgi:hypothetical protein